MRHYHVDVFASFFAGQPMLRNVAVYCRDTYRKKQADKKSYGICFAGLKEFTYYVNFSKCGRVVLANYKKNRTCSCQEEIQVPAYACNKTEYPDAKDKKFYCEQIIGRVSQQNCGTGSKDIA